MICISLGEISYFKALEICKSEDLVEIRADLSGFNREQLETLFNQNAQVVFTFRKSDYPDTLREEYYAIALDKNVKYIDVDFTADKKLLLNLSDKLNKSDSSLILSVHNYKETPAREKLIKNISDMREKGADVVKIATLVNDDRDLSTLLSLYSETGKKIILGMGDKGMLSRVAALFMGAEFTYAFPERGNKTAPGQLTKEDIEEILAIMKP